MNNIQQFKNLEYFICIHVYIYIYTHTRTYVCMCLVCIYRYMYTCMIVYIYVCIYNYVYKLWPYSEIHPLLIILIISWLQLYYNINTKRKI